MNPQMQLIFQDAEVYDVVLGRAIRTVPVDGEPPGVTLKREIYNECNLQAFSLIYRSFAGGNSGIVDASGATPNDGHALWTKLVRFNYQINDDSIPFLSRSTLTLWPFVRRVKCHWMCGLMRFDRRLIS